jgi:exodeoxyribonuclease VII large subunit
MIPPKSTGSNLKEYSVSEISGQVKRLIEGEFAHVRIRGELGRVVIAASGHVYLDLKDERAAISGVVWKGQAARLKVKPEQGLEVIATGRLTTFPGQSKYQIIIEALEPAGAGALMALFEERKKKLAAEGLFDEARKKPLPFLPKVIGVVTSPSGAVIRDILHRLRERFASHVLVWPSLVQGEKAAAQVIAGIEGFNALPLDGPVPRPDVIIVARGGGSLEDLWCFNDEALARAAAASDIPLISAVGHETDTTLIDFVADRRAPTPSAAAEIAVPVRSELLAELANKTHRIARVASRQFETARLSLMAAARGLGTPARLLDEPSQRLDRAGMDLRRGLQRLIERRGDHLKGLRLSPESLRREMTRHHQNLDSLGLRVQNTMTRNLQQQEAKLSHLGALLQSYSYQGVLERGYSLALDEAGRVIRSAKTPAENSQAVLRFADGERDITFGAGGKVKKRPKPGKPVDSNKQKSLF